LVHEGDQARNAQDLFEGHEMPKVRRDHYLSTHHDQGEARRDTETEFERGVLQFEVAND
jgi:hypothetical protein